MATSIDDVNRSLGDLSKQLTGSASSLKEITNSWRSAAQQGINFSGDAIGFRASIATTRMSFEEWGKAIDVGRLGMLSLGGTMNDSVKTFNRLSKEFSDAGDITDPLRKMGYNAAEYNQLLMMTLSSQRRVNLEDAKSKRDLFESTATLAKEMDAVAQMTGKSRQEQLTAMEERKRDFRLQAAYELELRKGNKIAVEGAEIAMVRLEKAGLESLGKALYTGQALTDKQAQLMSLLNDGGYALRSAMQAIKQAKTEEEKNAALDQLSSAQVRAAEQMHSTQMLSIVKTGTGEVIETLGEAQVASRNYHVAITKIKEERPGISGPEAEKIAMARIKADQESRGPKGEPILGAATTEAFNLGEARINDIAAASAKIADAANIRLGAGILSNDAKFLKDLKNVTAEGKPIAPAGGVIEESARSIKEGKIADNVTSIFRDAVEKGFKGITTLTADTINVMYKTAVPEKVEKPKFQDGTKTVLGDWFAGQFGAGTDVTLHGNEAVVPREKIDEFISDMQKSVTKTSIPVFDQMINKLGTLNAETVAKVPEVKDFNMIENTQSSTIDGLVDMSNLSNINTQLEKLNSNMAVVANKMVSMVEISERHYRTTKSMSADVNMM